MENLTSNENNHITEDKMDSIDDLQSAPFNPVDSPMDSTCPFCNLGAGRVLLLENETVYALLDKFPVSQGHTLIIPKRHCADYFAVQLPKVTF